MVAFFGCTYIPKVVWIKTTEFSVHILTTYGVGVQDSQSNLCSPFLQVNVIGVALVQREAVKSMLFKGIDDGHIVNLSR